MYLRIFSSRNFEDEPSKICSHSSGKGIKGRFFGLREKITLIKGKERKNRNSSARREEGGELLYILPTF